MTGVEFDFVCRFIRDRSAIVLESGQEYLVEARLAPIVRETNSSSISDLINRLRGSSADGLGVRIIEAIATNETSFFRDIHPFETLRTKVLPELIRKRQTEKCLNVWCAACSTGQEPYSLVMLIREHFPELARWQINILATDLSTSALVRAKEGRYNQIEVNRGLPAALMVKYFRQKGSSWELHDEVRRAVDFREMNFIQPWPFLPRMDLVFLRNVMIYFDVETKKMILGRIAKLLNTDGYLILGGAETTLNLVDSFRRNESLKGGFYQLTQ